MSDAGFLTLLFGAVGVVVMIAVLLLAVRLWDTLGEASEYFARENERYRREYTRAKEQARQR